MDDPGTILERGLAECVARGDARRRLARELVRRLEREGWLAGLVEQHYSAARVAELLGRSEEWVSAQVRRGFLGICSRDGGGWLIPASGVHGYLQEHVYSGSQPAPGREEAA